MPAQRKRRGFTLIKLLAVIAIIHVKWKRYGIGGTQKELLQSVKDAFPFETTVDPGGVGATVGEKDWLW